MTARRIVESKVHKCESLNERIGHKRPGHRGNSGIEKQHCMQGLRMDRARPTSLPGKDGSLWPRCALAGIFTTGEEAYRVVILAERILLRSSRRGMLNLKLYVCIYISTY